MKKFGLSCRLILGLWLMALAPIAAFAQGANGEITGAVKDTSGAVLPGVTVEASSPVLIEKVRSVVTSGDGVYRIVSLPPGNYTVTFTLPGFATYKREGFDIVGDQTVTVNADMKVGAQEETITVTGQAPIVDVQNVQRQTVLTNEVVDAVPTGKYFVNLGVLIPGVSASCSAACQTGVTQDTGGTGGDNMSTLVVHGSRFRDQRISINNLTVRGSTGYLGVTGPNIEAQQETQIDTSGADTSVGTGGVRINVVPKDGGNKFAGGFYGSASTSSLQSSNLSTAQKLLIPGQTLTSVTSVKEVYDIAPTFGGPIKQDKLWFFLAYRYNNAQNYQANTFQNVNLNNHNVWTYAPDTTNQGFTNDPLPMANGRITWQATPKNKFAFSFDYRDRCQCDDYGTGGVANDAVHDFIFRPQQIAMVTWSSPVTNKLLIQAAVVDLVEGWGTRRSAGETGDPSMIPVSATNTPASFLGVTSFRGYSATNWTQYPYRDTGINATYVTGAHAIKVGLEYDWGFNNRYTTNGVPTTNTLGYSFPVTSYTISYAPTLVAGAQGVNNCGGGQLCQPQSFITNLDGPFDREDKARYDGGLYAQDKWTFKRVTLSGGLRFDFFRRDTTAVTNGPTLLLATPITLPAQNKVTNYKDLSPRLGMAWDVFGNGKTALKASVNRYVQDLSLLANNQYSYQQNFQSTATRSWTDGNGNFVPDCNPLNPAAQNNLASGGDFCGAFTGTSANFGTSVATDVPASDVVSGFNHRGYNWEFSTSVQQEVVPHKVSVDVGFFRRWYGNLTITENPLAPSPSDFDQFSVVVPTDSRLPLSGQTISGFTNINPAFNGVTTTQDVFASSLGKTTDTWTGFDLSGTWRVAPGALVQGGMSSGKEAINYCAALQKDPYGTLQTVSLVGATGTITSQLGLPFCNNSQPFLNQWKGLATYTIPHADVQVSAAYQNIPGPQLAANEVLTSAQIQPSLGRATTGNANITVPLVAPGSLYGPRLSQLDLRVGKIIRFPGNRRLTGSVDLFNTFNKAAPITEQATYSTSNAAWGTPVLLQQGRLVKFTLVANF